MGQSPCSLMHEKFAACEERERLWQSWIDACGQLEGQGKPLEFARRNERRARSLLNEHMTSHGCGFSVLEPKLDA